MDNIDTWLRQECIDYLRNIISDFSNYSTQELRDICRQRKNFGVVRSNAVNT